MSEQAELQRWRHSPVRRAATEGESGDLPAAVLHAIVSGKTKHNEIKDWVGADPTRTLERLVRMRMIERLQPVTETGASRRRIYRITENLLAFYLGVINRHLPEIERGLGESILPTILNSLDDHRGGPWEAAMRDHLRKMAVADELDADVEIAICAREHVHDLPAGMRAITAADVYAVWPQA